MLFTDAEIQGCLWHLCRAFIKKAKNLRLLRFKRYLPELMNLIRKACAISLLPTRYFLTGLRLVRNEARETDIITAYLLEPFFDYVQERWINNANRRRWMSMFNSMHRTNNCCESHNKMLRKAVGAYRPNIYAFITALARLEHNAALDIESLSNGGAVKRSRRWQAVYADRAVEALSNDLQADVFRDRDVSVRNFIHRAANLFVTAYNTLVQREGAGN